LPERQLFKAILPNLSSKRDRNLLGEEIRLIFEKGVRVALGVNLEFVEV